MKRHFKGLPTLDDFELVSESLPKLSVNQILLQGEYWSVDPYQRAYPLAYGLRVPNTMIGSQVAKVIESKNHTYPIGSYVVAYNGWRELSIIDPEDKSGKQIGGLPKVTPAVHLGEGLPRSYLLGTIGMPGNSAYFGLLDICDPQPGETVVVSGAAGAVGNIVGQIAKIRGCRVVGIAGSAEKCQWLVQEQGFDHAINYKKGNIKSSLRRAAPKGVDCYFDNVGGSVTQSVMTCMNLFGRICVCGAIAGYNDDPRNPTLYPPLQPLMVANQLKMEGFMVWRWLEQGRWSEGLEQLKVWVTEGRIKQKETIVDGFENLPNAFIGMLSGDNLGKMVVKATTE